VSHWLLAISTRCTGVYKNYPGSTANLNIQRDSDFLLAGFLMGFFYRFVAASMSMDFVNPEAGKLTPYTASVIFATWLAAFQFSLEYIVYV
jgi:glucose uptake protein